MDKLRFIEIKSELGAGTRGASLGPDAIKYVSLTKGNDLFSRYAISETPNENKRLFEKNTTPWGIRIEALYRVFEAHVKLVSDELKKCEYLVTLAGDHSTAAATIAGIRVAHPDKKLGVIWVDAHADLHSPYSTPSGNLHGMPLGMALGIDNLETKVHDPLDTTKLYWEKLKHIGGFQPKIFPEDLVFIGVRDTEEAEDKAIANHAIRNITVEEVREKGIPTSISIALNQLKACDIIYVSFDVDSMDPSISRGTGTPVDGGFTVEETRELLCGLVSDKRTIAFEIVEVNPCLDNKTNTMAEVAFDLLSDVVACLEKK